MEEKYLPLGSVVLLKNGEKPVMVIGYKVKAKGGDVYQDGQSVKNEEKFDYCGCVTPIGMINSEFILMFNHENIEKVLFKGYEDEEVKKFNEFLKEDEK